MPVLFYYLLQLFLQGFAQIMGIFLGLFMLIDGVESIRRYSDKVNFNWLDLSLLMLSRLPAYITLLLPSIALLTTLVVLTRLSRQNEITVMRASGISLYRILIPFLMGGVLVAAVHVILQDQIIPRTNRTFSTLQDHLLDRPVPSVTESGNLWYRSGQQIIHAEKGSLSEQSLSRVIVFRFDEARHLVSRVEAKMAHYEEGRWYLRDGVEYVFGESVQAVSFVERPWRVMLDPNRLGKKPDDPQFLSINQLRLLAERLEREGADATSHWVTLHRKLADPATTIAAILLAFPFTLRLPREGGISRSILLGLLMGFALFVVVDLSTALGLGGRLPAALSAWAPVVFFMGIGGFLFLHLADPRQKG
ncbi:MAG: LPS export ABC transporter permease LptG [Magnetococcales bacterium]|nr:LPS export ABC transporter permease LptG [Magnetococcales bacterium]